MCFAHIILFVSAKKHPAAGWSTQTSQKDELKFLQDKNLSLLLFLKIYKSLVFKSSSCCVFRKDMKSTFCVYSDLDNFLRHPGNMKGSNSSNKSAGFNSRHVFPLSQTSLSLMENDPPGIYGSCHSSDLQRSSSVIINYKGVKVPFLQNIKWLKKNVFHKQDKL